VRLHGNARTCPRSRKLLCERVREQGCRVREAAEAAGISERTASKWLARYDAEGEAGMVDRTSRPSTIPVRVPEDRVTAIAGLRRLRMTGAQIAEALSMPLSTVGLVLRRIGLGSLRHLEPEEPEPLRAAPSRGARPHRRKEAGAVQTPRSPRTWGPSPPEPPGRTGVRPRLRRRRDQGGLRGGPRGRGGSHRGGVPPASGEVLPFAGC
jgi:hypothetical protein